MPFTFVHASDLQLGAPLFGVADLPDGLRSRIVNARFAAARRVFDLALAEQVDAVLLAGGVIAASAGPRAMLFFAEQCERLNAAGIAVCWSEAEFDLQRWLQYVPLPDNVSFVNPEVGQVYELSHGGRPEAIVLTPGATHRPHAEPNLLRIAAVPCAGNMLLPEISDVDYWALGGRSHPGAIPVGRGMAQFAGTTQGASPQDFGPRGCMVIRAGEGRCLTSRFVPTAAIDWREECISIDQDSDWASVRSRLTERVQKISRSAACEAVMVRWVLRGHGIVWQQLLRDDVNTQLLNELRSEFGQAARPVWSLFLEAAADGEPAASTATDDRCGTIPGRDVAVVDMAHAAGREPHFQQHLRERGRPYAPARR